MSTPTTPPAWLEAAAKLDALLGDKVPLAVTPPTPPAEDVTDELKDEAEPEAPELGDEADEEAGAFAEDEPDREGKAAWETQGDLQPRNPAEFLPFPGRLQPRPPAREPVAAEPPPEARPRPRITPPVVPAGASEPAGEADLAWHGYAATALLPSTLALAALTAGTIVVLRPLVPAWVMRESVDAPLAALWLLQAIRAAYRLLAYDYRLTTRRLFRDRGRLYPPEEPLELAAVVRAEVRQSLLDRLTGVGTVRVIPEDATPSRPAVELAGVRKPRQMAAQIDAAAQAAREGNVTAAKAELAAGART